MRKIMKYKLKLDYTADELKELKRLSKDYHSPMKAIHRIVAEETGTGYGPLRNLGAKYIAIGYKDESDFIADINNAVKGTAIFPDKKYVVHDSVTDRYVCFNALAETFCWSSVQSRIPEMKTKKEWLKINPAYETMLEKVGD
jgi:hypothetical protein